MIKPDLPPDVALIARQKLKECLHTILQIGDATCVDRKTSSRYSGIIIDIRTLTRELQQYANSN